MEVRDAEKTEIDQVAKIWHEAWKVRGWDAPSATNGLRGFMKNADGVERESSPTWRTLRTGRFRWRFGAMKKFLSHKKAHKALAVKA